MLLGDGDRGDAERKGRHRSRVQSIVHPKMKWIIECEINTANNLGSPLFRKNEKVERTERGRGGRDGQREKG